MLIGIVLGHRLTDSGTISSILRERLERMMEADRRLHPEVWILSGGIANPKAGTSEAVKMQEYLLKNGFSKDRLVLEDRSRNTRENARLSLKIASDLHADSILLVTSLAHLTRWYLNPIRLFAKEIGDSPLSLMTFTARQDFEIHPRR